MALLDTIPASCTTDDAARLIAAIAPQLHIRGTLPDVRTLRLWRTKHYLTVAGRCFTRRNVLEALAITKLRADGLTQQHAVKRIAALDEERLRLLLVGATNLTVTHVDAEPLLTLQFLAKGILEQYHLVRKGAVVGHLDWRATGQHNTPQNLQIAMARLGRHYFAEGREDCAASVHHLLELCTKPLYMWAPHVLATLQQYAQAILIDPIYRVPSEDCEAIAEQTEGHTFSDLIEQHLHHGLRTTLTKLGDDADAAYTTIRAFIGQHPLVTTTELQHLYLNPELNDEAISFVRTLYVPVHGSKAPGGMVHRCGYCNGLMERDGTCTLAGCHADHPTPRIAGALPVATAYVARPEVLKYWADPAREELRLFHALRKVRALRDRVQLYPHSDWCDVAIDDVVGIDVKDYHDPVRLAQRLNRSIGHLSQYPKQILAIAKRRWSPEYRDRLYEQLSPDRQLSLHIMSVDTAISTLKDAYGGKHAPDA